jgi:hypothetical protein
VCLSPRLIHSWEPPYLVGGSERSNKFRDVLKAVCHSCFTVPPSTTDSYTQWHSRLALHPAFSIGKSHTPLLSLLASAVLYIITPAPGHPHTRRKCIREFVTRVLERTNVSAVEIVLCLLYADTVTAGPVPPSMQRVFLGSLMVACKVRFSRSLWLWTSSDHDSDATVHGSTSTILGAQGSTGLLPRALVSIFPTSRRSKLKYPRRSATSYMLIH